MIQLKCLRLRKYIHVEVKFLKVFHNKSGVESTVEVIKFVNGDAVV